MYFYKIVIFGILPSIIFGQCPQEYHPDQSNKKYDHLNIESMQKKKYIWKGNHEGIENGEPMDAVLEETRVQIALNFQKLKKIKLISKK